MRQLTLVAAATVMLTLGCVSVPMYEGPERNVSEVGRFFTHGPRPNLRILTVDGKPLEIRMTKVLHFLPGPHTFHVQASNYQVEGRYLGGILIIASESNTFDQGTYQITAPIRAGYTYMVNYPINFSGPLPDRLCIVGEPHHAPGSSENTTGEERRMSPAAEVVGCGDVTDKKTIRK